MDDMTQQDPNTIKSGVMRYAPLALIVVVAVFGYFGLRDYLSFDTLRDNREALLAFRDGNYAAHAVLFVFAYILVVGFSLPGATIATLTGGFSVRDGNRDSVQCDRGDDSVLL